MDAAIVAIQQHGADALSLRRLAKQVGVSHAAPYRHFPTKEHLFAAIAAQGFAELRSTIGAVSATDAWLERAARAYLQFALDNPAHFQLMFSIPLSRTEHEALGDAGRATLDALVDGIVVAQAAGHVRDGDPLAVALTAWSTVHGLACLLVGGALPVPRFGTPQAVVERVIPQLLQSLSPLLVA